MALGALSPGVASVWVHLASPSDGARLKPGPLVWKPGGVAVIPFAEAPGGLRRGDVVLAVFSISELLLGTLSLGF